MNAVALTQDWEKKALNFYFSVGKVLQNNISNSSFDQTFRLRKKIFFAFTKPKKN